MPISNFNPNNSYICTTPVDCFSIQELTSKVEELARVLTFYDLKPLPSSLYICQNRVNLLNIKVTSEYPAMMCLRHAYDIEINSPEVIINKDFSKVFHTLKPFLIDRHLS